MESVNIIFLCLLILICFSSYAWAHGMVKDPLGHEMISIGTEEMRSAWSRVTQGENLALGKAYVLAPMPNYSLTTGQSDLIDLTDGKISNRGDDKIWFEGSAVGWTETGGPLVNIELDLGMEYPIDRVTLRILGGREQNMLKFPRQVTLLASSDGKRFYRIGQWYKYLPGDDISEDFVYLPEEGKAYVYPLTFQNLGIRARYIGISIESDGYLFMDEIAVIKGEDTAVELQGEEMPFNAHGAFVYPVKDAFYVCNNMAIFDWFYLSDMRKPRTPVTVILELPDGVELDRRAMLGGKDLAVSRHNKVMVDGKPYNRYELMVQKTTGRIGPIWLNTAWPEGSKGDAYIYAKWSGGEQDKRKVRVISYKIEDARVPRRLHTSIAWMTEDFQVKWPDFFNTYRSLGFNAVPFFPRYGVQMEWAKRAREEGFQIIYNESPFHVMQASYGKDPEMYVKFQDGSVGKNVSLAYRGKYYEKELERVADLAGKLQPDWVFHDIELFSSYAGVAQKDLLFLEQMEKFGDQTLCVLGKGMLEDLYRAVCSQGVKPLVGQYGTRAHRVYHQIFDMSFIYPEYVAFAMPNLYVQGDAALVGDDILNSRRLLPKGDIIPWLTAGTYGEFPSEGLKYMILEAFFNGARGITFYKIQDFDGLDFKYTAQAISMAAAVEDILIDGRPIDGRVQTSPDLRVSGLELSREAAILVSNYGANMDKEYKMSYKVDVASHVVDLETGNIIGIISPESPGFSVVLGPGMKAKAFHIRVIE